MGQESSLVRELDQETSNEKEKLQIEGSIKEKMSVLKSKAEQSYKSNDYETSADSYSQLLNLMTEELGLDPMSESLGPLYLAYGQSLLQIAIQKSSSELINSSAPSIPVALFKKEGIEIEDDSGEGEQEQEVQESEEDEFEMAWEILDTARLIFEKAESADSTAVFLMETHSLLADLSMETEAFSQAIPDLEKAISYARGSPDRVIASLYFRLGMAQEYDGRIDEAIISLKESKRILKECNLDSLIQEIDGKVR